MIERNGWQLYQHRAFQEEFTKLLNQVETLQKSQPTTYQKHPATKLLARLLKLMLDEIPQDPGSPSFLLGNTLGPSRRHWRRAKFLSRFRLFFQYASRDKIIVYAWVNDENTLRKAGDRSDPYFIFQKRVEAGNPPNNWEDLLKSSIQLPDLP